MRDFNDFMEKHRQEMYEVAYKNCKHDEEGHCLLPKDDPWMRTPIQSISKRYGILQQIKEREVWSTTPRDEYDIEVFDWHDIPLDHISTARISKAIVIPISDFRKRL